MSPGACAHCLRMAVKRALAEEARRLTPATPAESRDENDITAAGPTREVGSVLPRATAPRALRRPEPPTSRLSHPTRAGEPGSASSSSSMAAKWDRFATGRPVAWTAASRPAFHNGRSGPSAGCRPKNPSAASSRAFGTAIVGRAASYAGSPCGTTSDSPSAAPRRDTTTRADSEVAAVAPEGEPLMVTTVEPNMVVAPARAEPRSTPRRLARTTSASRRRSSRQSQGETSASAFVVMAVLRGLDAARVGSTKRPPARAAAMDAGRDQCW